MRNSRKSETEAQVTVMFEPLEPRVLFSAGLPVVPMDIPVAEVQNHYAIDIDANIDVNIQSKADLSTGINIAVIDVTLKDSQHLISSFDSDAYIIEYNGKQESLADILDKAGALSNYLKTDIASWRGYSLCRELIITSRRLVRPCRKSR